MAKIKFGMMMTDARGKLGGQVFSKNRSGAYVRTKVSPVNPQTVFQQQNRGILAQMSSAWSGLDSEARSAWNSQVEGWQKTNVFGDLQKPSGKNLFTGLNKVRFQMFPALAMLVTPPQRVELPALVITDAFYSTGTNNLAVELTGEYPADTTVQVRATPVVSAGTEYVKNLFRVLGPAVKLTEGNVINVGGLYSSRFGKPIVGDKIFIEVTPVAENGQLGVPSSYAIFAIA